MSCLTRVIIYQGGVSRYAKREEKVVRYCPRLDLRAPNTTVLNIAVVLKLFLPLAGNERQQSVELQCFTIGFLLLGVALFDGRNFQNLEICVWKKLFSKKYEK